MAGVWCVWAGCGPGTGNGTDLLRPLMQQVMREVIFIVFFSIVNKNQSIIVGRLTVWQWRRGGEVGYGHEG